MQLGLTGKGRGSRGPVPLACPRIASTLPGRRERVTSRGGIRGGRGSPQPQQSSPPEVTGRCCPGRWGRGPRARPPQGRSQQRLQGQEPGSPWLGPTSSGCCRFGSCSLPHWGLQTCWECKTPPQPGCTSWSHLGGDGVGGGLAGRLYSWLFLPPQTPPQSALDPGS